MPTTKEAPRRPEDEVIPSIAPLIEPQTSISMAEPSTRVRWLFLVFTGAALSAWALLWWSTPAPITPLRNLLLPQPVFLSERVALIIPGYEATAELTGYQDELFAYLMFDYLRHSPALRRSRLLLEFGSDRKSEPYRLVMRGQTDLLAAIADFTMMRAPGVGGPPAWKLTPADRVEVIEQQTSLFVSAYNLPVKVKLEDLPRKELRSYLRRFIRFKSATDPRIRLGLEPTPRPLSSGDAQQLAGDILTIAEFFDLPLEFFLGIGAMENNFMNVRGDLQHSIWKRRPASDDVILQKRRGRVRVLNDSAGVWQITRETLRYAHRLILRDSRDYTKLPAHLQPPREMKVNEVDPHVLTTYAGILLRDLLDQFQGDVNLAVSAYNGGPARPNLRYGEGVGRAAAHARRILEQAAVLNGESVVRMSWLRP